MLTALQQVLVMWRPAMSSAETLDVLHVRLRAKR